jgi:hypothetical protein
MYTNLTNNPNNFILSSSLIEEKDFTINIMKEEFEKINLQLEIQELIFNLLEVNPKDRIDISSSIKILDDCINKL